MQYAEINLFWSDNTMTIEARVRSEDDLSEQQKDAISKIAGICARNNFNGVLVYLDPISE